MAACPGRRWAFRSRVFKAKTVWTDGLYGIGCEQRFSQFEFALSPYPAWPVCSIRVFPIAYDELEGHVFFRTAAARNREIWYSPWDMLADEGPDLEDKLFRVMPDIQSFGALITGTN